MSANNNLTFKKDKEKEKSTFALPNWDRAEISKRLQDNAQHLKEWTELLERTEKLPADEISAEDALRHNFLRKNLHENLGLLATVVKHQLKAKPQDQDAGASKEPKKGNEAPQPSSGNTLSGSNGSSSNSSSTSSKDTSSKSLIPALFSETNGLSLEEIRQNQTIALEIAKCYGNKKKTPSPNNNGKDTAAQKKSKVSNAASSTAGSSSSSSQKAPNGTVNPVGNGFVNPFGQMPPYHMGSFDQQNSTQPQPQMMNPSYAQHIQQQAQMQQQAQIYHAHQLQMMQQQAQQSQTGGQQHHQQPPPFIMMHPGMGHPAGFVSNQFNMPGIGGPPIIMPTQYGGQQVLNNMYGPAGFPPQNSFPNPQQQQQFGFNPQQNPNSYSNNGRNSN